MFQGGMHLLKRIAGINHRHQSAALREIQQVAKLAKGAER